MDALTLNDRSAPSMIRIEGASKTFTSRSGEVIAVDHADLSVQSGEFIAIVGPSGCGKTTLLRMMAGLESVTSGRILVDGEEVTGPSPKLGVVFQRPVLLEWRTILENVILPIELRRKPSDQDRTRVRELLDLVGLADFADHYPRQLSGGMQQRASICRALVSDPEVILLDEPFGALDALTREHMHLEFNELWRSTGKTVVMITHDIPEAVFLSQRVLVMTPRPGRIADEFEIPFAPVRDARLQADPRFGSLALQIRESLEAQEATE